MKKIVTGLFFTIAVSLIPVPSQSQEHQGCFWIDPNGKLIPLDNICPGGNNIESNGRNTQVNTPTAVRQTNIIPIKRRQSGIPVVEVVFNGEHTFEMLLDTGASLTVVTREIADVLDIEEEGSIPVATPSDARTFFPIGKVDEIAVGNTKAINLDVAISPSIDIGLLGQNFFSNFDLIVGENTIEFRRRS